MQKDVIIQGSHKRV